jgi:hypothetical protein
VELHHLILLAGPAISVFFWVEYAKSGSDNYGIGALITFSATAITYLLFCCAWLFGKYMGWF